MDAPQTPTVRAIASELQGEPVPPERVVEAILARHRGDYATGAQPVAWPEQPRVEPVERWLEEARELLTMQAHPELHGRAVILALALAEPPAGRALVRAGVFHSLAVELRPRLVEGLTPVGLERLTQIPLVGATEGVAMGPATLGGAVNDVAFSPNGQLIAAGWGIGAGGWTLLTRSRRRQLRTVAAPSPVTHVGFTPDGREVAAGFDDQFDFFDLRGRPTRSHEVGGPRLVGAGIAVGMDSVIVGDVRAQPFTDVSTAAIATEAGVVAGAHYNGSVLVWRAADRAELGRIELGGEPAALALSRDGTRLVTRRPGSIALWDVASGRSLWSFEQEGSGPVALSGDRVAAAGERAWLRDAGTGAPIVQLTGDVAVVAFSHDGTRLATGSSDGTVVLYNPSHGAVMGLLFHTAPITTLTWAPDGEQLVTGTAAGVLTAWAGGFEPAPRRRLAAYSPDDTRAANDLATRLEIDPDVDALATLIAARAVEPPLSVGLFGDWGSGKTFFMRRLQRRVAELAADARDSGELQRDVAWHKRIVQVEFNAWHYAEGNLWASLVEHILDNLRLSPDEPADLVERRRREVVERITDQTAVTDGAREAAERSLAAVTEQQAALERDLLELEHDDELQRATPLRGVVDAVLAATGAVRTARGHEGAQTVAELTSALDETQATLTRGSQVLAPLLYDARHRGARLVMLIVLLALAPAAAWLVGLVAPAAVESLTGVVALIAGGSEWLRRQAGWTRGRLDELERAGEALDAPARQVRATREREVRRLQEEHDAAARTAVEEADRLHALERELAETTPSRLLARLIADRVRSDDYRRHLGVLALVRRDFEAMSDYLRLQAGEIDGYETLEQEEADDEVRVGRIVLYVDDLDRCEPAQVVAVLQAVHLLLAFPLFTVVVGVDVRWVERALRLHHRELLDSGGADPRDYLEKIFQIPFWLEPLDAGASRRMLRGMLGTVAEPRATAAAAAPGEPAAAATGTPEASEAPAAAPAAPPPPPPAPPPRDLLPASLEVGDLELTCMDALAPLLGRSPRALKRFVNTYRLIKVRAEDPVAYLRDQDPIAPYRAALLLLALATGVPQTAAGFLDAVLRGDGGTVEERLKGAEDARVTAWLAGKAATPWRTLELAALAPQAEEIVRFTFHWHQSMYS